MKSTQTIFCKDNGTVTISASEYNKLLLYKELALEMKEVLKGDSQWTAQVTHHGSMTWTITSTAHIIIKNATLVSMLVMKKVMKYDSYRDSQTGQHCPCFE